MAGAVGYLDIYVEARTKSALVSGGETRERANPSFLEARFTRLLPSDLPERGPAYRVCTNFDSESSSSSPANLLTTPNYRSLHGRKQSYNVALAI